jgi:hypothetical protein
MLEEMRAAGYPPAMEASQVLTKVIFLTPIQRAITRISSNGASSWHGDLYTRLAMVKASG